MWSGDGVVFADEAVGELLALGGEVAVGQEVSVEALAAANVGGGQDRKGQTRKAAYVDFVRRQPSGGVDRVVVGGFDVRNQFVPVILSLVAAH